MYTEFYGLREKPFQLSPDPRFLFLAESHREALAHLLFGIEQGEGFIAVTGEVGTGKTTLCRTLLQRVEPGCEVAIIFHPQLTAQELLESIDLEFGLEVGGRSRRELMDELNRFLLERKEHGRRVLLIVDEAQNLSPDALEQIRMLSNLETETSKLIQIILLGQPEFDVMLESASLRQLRQRVSVRWRLTPLSASETVEYVKHRLRVAAGAERDLFTEVALREIHRRSGGIPRVVNLLCDRALLAGYAAGARSIGLPFVAQAERELRGGAGAPPLRPTVRADRRPLLRVAAGAVLVVAGAGLALLWQRTGGTPTPEALRATIQESRPRAPARSDAPPIPKPVGTDSMLPVTAAAPPRELALSRPAKAIPSEPMASTPTLEAALAASEPGVCIARALDAALSSWGFAPVGAASLSLEAALAELRARELRLQPVNRVDVRALSALDQLALVSLRAEAGEERTLLLRSVGDVEVEVMGALEGGAPLALSRREFDGRVVGEAYVIWQDFEALPPVLRAGQRGPAVVWLQESLRDLGLLAAHPSGAFDAPTGAAVRAFQRARGLVPDGEVGPRTQMALYAALERYPVPRLSIPREDVG